MEVNSSASLNSNDSNDRSMDNLWDGFSADPDKQNKEIALSSVVASSRSRTKRRFTCSRIDRNQVIRISVYVLSSTTFAVSTYFFTTESLTSRNIKILTVTALVMGGTSATFFETLLSSKNRKKINDFINAWTYEILLGCSQVYLNLAPANLSSLLLLPFIYELGAQKMKDVVALSTMEQSDLPISTEPPSQEEIIKTLGFNTRDYSKGSILWLTGLATAGIALTALNFGYLSDQYQNFGDYGKIGVYQDLIALFTGSIAGNLVSRLFVNYKEKLELRHAGQLLTQDTPRKLKVARVAEMTLFLFTPTLWGTLLAFNTVPNTLGDYLTKFTVGNLFGADLLITKRKFEDPNSYLHAVAPIKQDVVDPVKDDVVDSVKQDAVDQVKQDVVPVKQDAVVRFKHQKQMTTCAKVKSVASKYLPSITFFALLIGYMSWAAATNISRVDYAIVVLLVTSISSFVFTDIIASKRQIQGNRFFNELVFNVIFARVLSMPYQYLRTKIDISDQYIDDDSNSLYTLVITTWALWGLIVGGNRATQMQRPRIPGPRTTPPIAMVELSQPFINNLQN
jgi:hypothetical protein